MSVSEDSVVFTRLENDTFEDEKLDHSKHGKISPVAYMVWTAALMRSNRHKTFGEITDWLWGKISLDCGFDAKTAIEELQQRDMLQPSTLVQGNWFLTNYRKYQRTSAEVRRDREQAGNRARQRTWYDRHERRQPDEPPPSNGHRNGDANADTNAEGVRQKLSQRDRDLLDISEIRQRRLG